VKVIDADAFVIQVSLDELRLLASSIGEALEAVEDWEFSTRLGADSQDARALRSQLNELIGPTPSD
jgi:hypothetical protein